MPPGSLGSPTLHLLHTSEFSASVTWLPPLTSFGRFLLHLTLDVRPTSHLSCCPLLAQPPASDTCATASCLRTTLHTCTGDVPEPPSISFWLPAIHHTIPIISIHLTKAWNLWLLDGLPPPWVTHSSGPGVPCDTRHHTGTPQPSGKDSLGRGDKGEPASNTEPCFLNTHWTLHTGQGHGICLHRSLLGMHIPG